MMRESFLCMVNELETVGRRGRERANLCMKKNSGPSSCEGMVDRRCLVSLLHLYVFCVVRSAFHYVAY